LKPSRMVLISRMIVFRSSRVIILSPPRGYGRIVISFEIADSVP
jgi:hypothetical protein